MTQLTIRLLAAAGDWTIFAGRAIRECFRRPFEVHEIARHLFELGCRSLPLIAASGFAVGLVLSMHTRASLARFGAEALISFWPTCCRAGALERGDRTALRIWIDAAGLFAMATDGTEQLTESGKRRLESEMADLVRYPRDSPIVVEGYAESPAGEAEYLVSLDRALLVRDHLLSRFRRRVTLTGVMPMGDQALQSPRGNRWSGVALALFVHNDAFRERH